MKKAYQFQDNGILYLTDDPETLEELLSHGLYGIPVYTERNGDAKFPHTKYALSEPESFFDRDLCLEGFDEIPENITRIYRRLAGLPWDILETPRTRIRETTVADVDTFYEIYADPEVTAYMEDLFKDPEEEKLYTRNYIEQIYGFYEYGIWTVLDRETGDIIGRAGITDRDGSTVPEIGYMIRKEYRKKGYAYEVCRALLDYAGNELGCPLIRAYSMPENLASGSLLIKLGFVRKESVPIHEIPHDLYEISL